MAAEKQKQLNSLRDRFCAQKNIILHDQLDIVDDGDSEDDTMDKFNSRKQRNCICWSRGNPDASVVIVSETPAYDDIDEGILWTGNAYDGMCKNLVLCGVDIKSVYFTTVTKIRHKEDRYESRLEEFRQHGQYFVEEMLIVRPKLIIPIGGRTIAYLLKQCDANRVQVKDDRGTVDAAAVGTVACKFYPIRLGDDFLCWVMPMYHHGYFRVREDDKPYQKMAKQKAMEKWLDTMRSLDKIMARDPLYEISDLVIEGNEQLHRDAHLYPYVLDSDTHVFHHRPYVNMHEEELTFQVMEMRYNRMHNLFQAFGRTREDHSVYCCVTGVQFHFFINDISEGKTLWSIDTVQREYCIEHTAQDWNELKKSLVSCETVWRENFFGYTGGRKSPFIQITVKDNKYIRRLDEILRAQKYDIFESHVAPETQMMLQCGMYTAGWVTLPAGQYRQNNKEENKHASSCDVEVQVNIGKLVARDPKDSAWAHNAPCHVLSFDIECYRNNPGFPSAVTDQIVCIVCTVQTINDQLRVSIEDSTLGEANYDRVDVFVCGTCDPIDRYGAQVHCFRTEEDMLVAWTRYVSQTDPDIVTGYNSKNFDERYIIDRGRELGLKQRKWRGMGRLYSEPAEYRESKFHSRAFGERTQITVNMSGRVNMDLLEVMLREFKLPSYTLNYVAQRFLKGDKKVDVPYSAIPSLFKQSARTRQRLCYYCAVDTVLPLRLLNHLNFFYTVVEMSRMVSCVFPTDIYVRGVQIKVFSAVQRENELDGHTKLFPAPEPRVNEIEEIEEGDEDENDSDEEKRPKAASAREVGFEGAVVIDPVKGYHENVICFDFESLYPSIHNARNVSHDTEIPVDHLGDFPELSVDDVWKSPSEPVYYVKVRKERQADGTMVLHRQGFLPRTLQKMLADRKAVKRQMKALEKKHRDAGTQLMADSVDSVQYFILDAKQKSIKIICNSVYGATGATGPLGHKKIGSTITAFGREFLFLARDSILKQYPGSVCVGGDT